MRSFRILGLALLTAAIAGCSGGGGGDNGPVEGWLRLTLDTPNAGDGSILFKIQGGPIDTIAGGAMMQRGDFNQFPTFMRVVVSGDLVDGPVAYIGVPDIRDVADYTVTVEQVAVKATNAQRSLTGYSVSVAVDD
jgi:hypothetical protein